jgi:prepilin-type processing-associated H-X9-DG protein
LNAQSAFARVDLLATLAASLLLIGWLAFNHSGERGRIAHCDRNLQVLAGAMQSFANDHGSALPPAGIEAPQITWDMQLAPYLKPGLAVSNSAAAWQSLLKAVGPRFFCPSDPVVRGDHPRSYAMSAHNMKPENWPPGPDDTTGLGLWWGETDAARILGHDTQNLDELALVKLAWLPDPADTLLLTEYPERENRMQSKYDIRLAGADQQANVFVNRANSMHFHRFNYLMADGHVELLSPLQTRALDGSAGIWTIKKGD